ncbi:MAG TPA: hypothetical protein VFZ61_20460 [Polyangiales bacterium]
MDRDPLERAQRRRNVRYKADPSEHAQLDFRLGPAAFAGQLAALILDHSFHGCCLVAVRDQRLVVGARLRLKLGVLDPLDAQLRWAREVGDELVRVGLYMP